jgi:hypothetical protein
MENRTAAALNPKNSVSRGPSMRRRQAIGLLGAASLAQVSLSPQIHADESEVKRPAGPPRLTVEELAMLIKKPEFQFDLIYAHEIDFHATILIKREVPLAQFKEMKDQYSKVHLYGRGGNIDVGKELIVSGLIVDQGFGALMVWVKSLKYADG